MQVAVLGLGRMGTPIAQRLERAGHELSVWNRSPEAMEAFRDRGVRCLESLPDAWTHADLVVTMLADDSAVQAVVTGEGGLLSGPGEGTLVDMSTISAPTSARIAERCEGRGVGFLRAPVSGNPSVVVAGNLGIIVSGPRDTFERWADTLTDIGPKLFYVGPGDEARIVKLALNLMIGGTVGLMAEALVLAEKHGIGRAAMLEVMGGSAIGSPFVKYKTEALVADDYSSTFTVTLAHKDLDLALRAGAQAQLPMPLTALTQQLTRACIATGMGDLDISALLPWLRQQAGL